MLRNLLLGTLVLGTVAGCGGGGDVEVSQKIEGVPTEGIDQLRVMLEETANSGKPLGSGAVVYQRQLNMLSTTDMEKAKALQPYMDELMGLTDPAKIKAKAKEFLSKL
ncbi:MAG: hypothetical protein MUD03_02050 [Pirellula sp.]|nr:hypothetical protein [Pirellula sp.]